MSASFLVDIATDGVPTATLTSQLRVIQRATRRANALIQDLLDVSRIDAGSLAVDAKPASAASLINDAALELEPLAKGNGLVFESGWVGEDIEVMADRGRIIQVFSNLVGNALKFTEVGGTITIRGQRVANGAQFQVSDTGSGIAADHLPHLFDRFWKASQSSRTGAGLGLSIVRGIIESHRGELTVASQPGAGTTFTFVLASAGS
jgi:signal transduction histidine kinase